MYPTIQQQNTQQTMPPKKKKKKAPPCIIVDLGSCALKVGIASNTKTSASWSPDNTISCCTLPTENRATMKGETARQQWDRRAELIRPIQRGKITDMEQLKLLLTHAFNDKLDVTTKGSHILFADAPGHGASSRSDREELMTWTFEKLQMQSCMFIPQPILAAFAAGKTTAIVVDAGFESSSVTKIIDGSLSQSNVHRINYPSFESTMLEMMVNSEKVSATGEAQDIPSVDEIGTSFRLIAEGTCYCCLHDIEREKSKSKSGRTKKKYQLPDGTWIGVSEERFLLPETMCGGEYGNRWRTIGTGGLGGSVANQLKSCNDRNTYFDLANNIICCGGRSEIEHFDQRLDLEISKGLGLKPRPKKSLEDDLVEEEDEEDGIGEKKIDMRPQLPITKTKSKKKPRKFATYAGGAMVASIDSMRSLWITKPEFEEYGADVCIDRRRLS